MFYDKTYFNANPRIDYFDMYIVHSETPFLYVADAELYRASTLCIVIALACKWVSHRGEDFS